jgi:hypothetical protein
MSVVLRPTVPADLSAVVGEVLPYRIKALTAVIPPSPAKGDDGQPHRAAERPCLFNRSRLPLS